MWKLQLGLSSSRLGTLLKSGSDSLPSVSFHHYPGDRGALPKDTELPENSSFSCHQDAWHTAQICAPDSPFPQRPHSFSPGASSPPSFRHPRLRPCLSLPCPVASLSGSLGRSPNRIGQLRYVWWLKAGGREAEGWTV